MVFAYLFSWIVGAWAPKVASNKIFPGCCPEATNLLQGEPGSFPGTPKAIGCAWHRWWARHWSFPSQNRSCAVETCVLFPSVDDLPIQCVDFPLPCAWNDTKLFLQPGRGTYKEGFLKFSESFWTLVVKTPQDPLETSSTSCQGTAVCEFRISATQRLAFPIISQQLSNIHTLPYLSYF